MTIGMEASGVALLNLWLSTDFCMSFYWLLLNFPGAVSNPALLFPAWLKNWSFGWPVLVRAEQQQHAQIKLCLDNRKHSLSWIDNTFWGFFPLLNFKVSPWGIWNLFPLAWPFPSETPSTSAGSSRPRTGQKPFAFSSAARICPNRPGKGACRRENPWVWPQRDFPIPRFR